MFSPKVSIVIPVYNGSDYMRDAIDSALAQTYSNIEVIVVNDGSRDNGETDRIARSYGDKIRYFSKPNGGVATALNYGIEHMEGEYFSWLSHDDKYKEQKIELQIKKLETLKDKTTLLYGGYENFSDEDGVFETLDFTKKYPKDKLETHLFPVFHLALNGCTLLIHRSHFERAGMFDPSLPTTQDYELWFRIFRQQKPCCLPGCQVLSRSHPNQGSKAMKDIHLIECERMWKNCISQLTDQEINDLSDDRLHLFLDLYSFFSNTCDYPGFNAYLFNSTMKEFLSISQPSNTLLNKIEADLGIDVRSLPLETDAVRNAICQHNKDRKRIAFFLGTPNELGGLNRIVLQTASQLCTQYDVWLVDTIAYDGTGYEIDPRIHEVTVKWDIQQIANIFSLLQVDVLIGSYNCHDLTLSMYNIVKHMGIKVIAWSHEHYFSPYRFSMVGLLGHRLETLGSVDAVVWLTNYSAAIYALHHDNGVCIPNMLSVTTSTEPESKCSFKKDPNEKIVLSVGRFDDKRKSLDKLLKAFALIHRNVPSAKLLLIGKIDWDAKCCVKSSYLSGSEYKTYKDILKECNLPANSVIAVGEVKDVTPYYQAADIQLFASQYEGFGLVITEASNYHVPTIALSDKAFEDIIENGQSGFIASDINEMAEKATLLLNDLSKRAEMGQNAFNSLTKFSPANITAQWIDLIDSVLSPDKSALTDYLDKKHKESPALSFETMRALIREYEADIQAQQGMPPHSSGNAFTSHDDSFWHQQATNMENTLSWRITKPLRQVRTLINELKKE